jgi:hypothetical protein
MVPIMLLCGHQPLRPRLATAKSAADDLCEVRRILAVNRASFGIPDRLIGAVDTDCQRNQTGRTLGPFDRASVPTGFASPPRHLIASRGICEGEVGIRQLRAHDSASPIRD